MLQLFRSLAPILLAVRPVQVVRLPSLANTSRGGASGRFKAAGAGSVRHSSLERSVRLKSSPPRRVHHRLTPSPASSAATMAPVRILVVEDESKLADLLARGLREEGHAADVATEGE